MKKLMNLIVLTMAFPFLGICQGTTPWDDLADYLPLVREGVQWVNEKVIINNGDTTSFFYTYLIQGDAPDTDQYVYSHGNVKACHYYEYVSYNSSKDSIISCLEEPESSCRVVCFGNKALDKVERENRNLLNRSFYIDAYCAEFLYFFGHAWIDGTIMGYISRQNEPVILNEENFIEVSPVQIEGYNCHRIAYVNEQGDTLALLVEGIGFDSRDMGDLLTPFTHKPDPYADYQEYWGLSHVIKDGKIIYKGMRYRENIETAIDEVVADKSNCVVDDNYYNLMGQPVGKQMPTTPGIYIHNGKKICVGQMQ